MSVVSPTSPSWWGHVGGRSCRAGLRILVQRASCAGSYSAVFRRNFIAHRAACLLLVFNTGIVSRLLSATLGL